jgi:hypothetical protein
MQVAKRSGRGVAFWKDRFALIFGSEFEASKSSSQLVLNNQ